MKREQLKEANEIIESIDSYKERIKCFDNIKALAFMSTENLFWILHYDEISKEEKLFIDKILIDGKEFIKNQIEALEKRLEQL